MANRKHGNVLDWLLRAFVVVVDLAVAGCWPFVVWGIASRWASNDLRANIVVTVIFWVVMAAFTASAVIITKGAFFTLPRMAKAE